MLRRLGMGATMSPTAGAPSEAPSSLDPQLSTSRTIAWATVAALLVVAVLSYLDRQIISLLVAPIRNAFHVSDFEVGLLQGVAFGLFYAAFGLPIGWLVDRTSRRGIIFVGTLIWSVAAAMCGLAATFNQLLVARFAVGIGEAALSPAAYSMIADLFPRRRLALAISVFSTGSAIGGAVAFIVGGALIGHLETLGNVSVPFLGALAPWQLIFILTGAPGVLVALLMLVIPEPKRTHQAQATKASNRDVLRFLGTNKRYFSLHFIGFGLIATMAYGTAAWTPTMLMRHYGLKVADVGLVMGAIAIVCSIGGFVFSGWFVDRWYARGRRDAHIRYFMYTSVIGGVAAFCAFQLATSLGMFLLFFAIVQFLLPITGPAVAHLQLATPSAYRGRVSALFVLIFNLMGMCLGPPSVAFITDFVFEDIARVNSSIAVMFTSLSVLAFACFAFNLAPARRAVLGDRD
jgi:MFS family permease